ncbi:hypothetical protein BH09BAC1_BH09BAC1_30380 [soil metagenome]
MMKGARLLIIHEGDTERLFYKKVITEFIGAPLTHVDWKNAESVDEISFHNIVR